MNCIIEGFYDDCTRGSNKRIVGIWTEVYNNSFGKELTETAIFGILIQIYINVFFPEDLA